MNITINIQAPELAQAIFALANAFSQNPKIQPNPSMVSEMNHMVGHPAPVQQEVHVTPLAPVAPPVQNAVPVAPPTTPVQNVAPVAPPQQQPQPVPTSAPTYTMDQLAVAATQLVDANRREELLQLLAMFGVNTLLQLPKEQYGNFATKLRELGAKI